MKSILDGRWIPEGSTSETFDDVQAVVYIRNCKADGSGGFTAIAYSAKRNKPDWHYGFKNRERLDRQIASWVDGLRQSNARREAKASIRRMQSAQGHSVKVGDVFHYSWGYDQTNVQYFQVVAVTKATVTVHEIGQEQVEQTGWASARVKARPGAFLTKEKPFVKRVSTLPTGEHYLLMDHGIGSLDKGGDSYSSWYA